MTETSRLTEHERFMITRARGLARPLRRSGGDRGPLAGQLLTELADLAERLGGGGDPALVIGYLVDGKLWHPSDVTIVRQGAAQAAEAKPPSV